MDIKRDYINAPNTVKELYRNQRLNQSFHFTQKSIDKYFKFTNKNTFWELFSMADIKDISIQILI